MLLCLYRALEIMRSGLCIWVWCGLAVFSLVFCFVWSHAVVPCTEHITLHTLRYTCNTPAVQGNAMYILFSYTCTGRPTCTARPGVDSCRRSITAVPSGIPITPPTRRPTLQAAADGGECIRPHLPTPRRSLPNRTRYQLLGKHTPLEPRSCSGAMSVCCSCGPRPCITILRACHGQGSTRRWERP